MAHAEQHAEKSTAVNPFYTFLGLLLGAAIGGPFLYAMMFLLNQ